MKAQQKGLLSCVLSILCTSCSGADATAIAVESVYANDGKIECLLLLQGFNGRPPITKVSDSLGALHVSYPAPPWQVTVASAVLVAHVVAPKRGGVDSRLRIDFANGLCEFYELQVWVGDK